MRCSTAGGKALVAGLVNGHTHAAMTLFRGYADDLPLMEWLEQHIWPAEAKLEPEDVYWGTRLACVEMIRTGTTRFWDMYWHPEAVAERRRGRGLAGRRHRAADRWPRSGAGTPKGARASRRGRGDLAGGRIAHGARPARALHGRPGVAALGCRAERPSDRGDDVQIHLSETEGEVADCVAEQRRPARPSCSIAAACSARTTVLAHGVWLDDSELELIAERGATVVTNPVANMKLAVGGAFPYTRARRARRRARHRHRWRGVEQLA